MIKLVAPSMAYQVIDRAIQVSHPRFILQTKSAGASLLP